MEWISVTSRPKIGEDVLVCQRKKLTTDNLFVAYLNSYTVRENREDLEWCSNGDYDISDITHWMPLPEPPKS